MKAARIVLFCSLSLLLAGVGCKNAQDAQVESPSQDPAAANLAPVSDTTSDNAAPNAAYDQGGQTAPAPARQPTDRQRYSSDQPGDQKPSDQDSGQYASSDNYNNSAPDNSSGYPPSSNNGGNNDNGNGYSDYNNYDTPVEYAPEPPPQLPVYQQPPCPGDDYMWTPGYWNYDNGEGYYWVPGAWVLAPYSGALWTPGWWGYDRSRYGWHRGFWGRHIGYYGGVNYGHGYEGRGYEGGYWRGDHFNYNRTVNNINTTVVHNVYNYQITNITNINNTRISYNGGRGGIGIRPRPAEMAALREQHNPPMTAQVQQVQEARSDRQNFVRFNGGKPAMAVVTRPLPADRSVRPPAPVNYQVQQRPAEPGRAFNQPPVNAPPVNQRPVNQPPANQAPVQFHNNVHPVPAGPHVMEQRPPAQGSPAYPRNGAPTQQPNRAPEPQNNHQPAPGRPEMQRPMPAPAQAQPQRQDLPHPEPQHQQAIHPAPAPPPARPVPQQRTPEPVRPAPAPAPVRPVPQPQQRVEPPHPAPPPPPQRSAPEQRPTPPQEHHAAPPPPPHPGPEKKPNEPKQR